MVTFNCNLTQSRISWAESLNMQLFTLGLPVKVTLMKLSSLLWKGVLNCEKSGETQQGTNKRAWVHSFLSLLDCGCDEFPALTSLQ